MVTPSLRFARNVKLRAEIRQSESKHKTIQLSGIEIGLRKPSDGAGTSAVISTAKSTGGVLSFLMLMPGLLACMLVRAAYPLLDDRIALGLMIAFFLLPFVVQLFLILRKQSNARLLRIVYACSGCALVILALVFFVNGGMDRSPGTVMRASVIRKSVLIGRHGTRQYHLKVSSWRPGRDSEDLNVSSGVFRRAAVGRSVAIEVHRGYLNLPWSEKISAE
ncbi:MAG TPA: hypothetical protein VKS44_03160 [Candidatus Acidoferrales bacterium]|nr:hypothetical protein [Candidatus Acidoferrales bacterium]